ncbi:MAG: carbon storage regulator [Acidobacteria bacterium]|nr:MAG: carbon storage regulator [Acidobacteriota bacterium]RPJ75803.1 MAG: carbon storage regulator [Acidobacteriota bacterium]
MLVFTRKNGEAIVIGDGVEVRVLRVGRDSVRIGVVAPASVPVHRLEVYEQIRRENQAAADAAAGLEALAKRLRGETPALPEDGPGEGTAGAGGTEPEK